APKTQQVLDAEHRSSLIVGEQTKGFGVVRLREDINHRQVVSAEIDRWTPVSAPCSDHQAVNLLPEQLVEMLTFARRVVGSVAHEHCDAVVRKLPFEGFENRQRETTKTIVG